MAIKVALVEDNVGLRLSWAKAIADAPGFQCVCACGSAEEALKKIPPAGPDVVLMDINLPQMNGVECTALLKQRLPQTQFLIVTVHGDNDQIFSALQAGASGYLLKRTGPAELLGAITEVMQGGVPMSGEIARKVIASFRRPVQSPSQEKHLTPREEDILGLLSRGYANKEIADRLGVGYETVRTHLCNIYEKLHVRSRTEAAAKYFHISESKA